MAQSLNTLTVLHTTPLTTVQDLGRPAQQPLGIPASGAMDPLALRAANRLVGNEDGAAALEVGSGSLTFVLTQPGLLAAAGSGVSVTLDARPAPSWTALYVRPQQTIHLTQRPGGLWAYLACAGGIEVPPVLGSRATYLPAHFGGHLGRTLQTGDVLPLGPTALDLQQWAGASILPPARPPYAHHPTLPVILGPQAAHFTPAALATFCAAPYTLTHAADRMGYRLAGPPLAHAQSPDLLSEGLAFGAIQVPADGQPLVMMADRPTTGGYPKIATLTSLALPLLAQCTPGRSQIRFAPLPLATAQAHYRQALAALRPHFLPD